MEDTLRNIWSKGLVLQIHSLASMCSKSKSFLNLDYLHHSTCVTKITAGKNSALNSIMKQKAKLQYFAWLQRKVPELKGNSLIIMSVRYYWKEQQSIHNISPTEKKGEIWFNTLNFPGRRIRPGCCLILEHLSSHWVLFTASFIILWLSVLLKRYTFFQ